MDKCEAIQGSLNKWKGIYEELTSESVLDRLCKFVDSKDYEWLDESKFDQMMHDEGKDHCVINYLCPMCAWTKKQNNSVYTDCSICDLHDEGKTCCNEWDKIDSLAQSMKRYSVLEYPRIVEEMESYAGQLVIRLTALLFAAENDA